MHLKKNSWYYWLYTKTYDSFPPTNLCPFFWKLVFAIISFPLLFSFFLIAEIIRSVGNLFIKDKEEKIAKIIYFSYHFAVAFVIYFFLFIICSMVSVFFISGKSDIFLVGIVGWIIFTTIILSLIGMKIKDYYFKRRWSKGKKEKPSLVKEYYKAFIGKYCPKIDWE
jgi:Na+/H+-translocating membrane pyrophosphatase